MGHYSYLTMGQLPFLWVRDGYDPELAALFTEAEREYLATELDGERKARYGYFAIAGQLSQRLQLQGFTAAHARAAFEDGIKRWLDDEKAHDDRNGSARGPEWRRPRQAEELLGVFCDLAIGEVATGRSDLVPTPFS